MGEINPSNKSIHLNTNQIYIGASLHRLFQKEEYKLGNMIEDVKDRCRSCACLQIKQRFDINSILFKKASSLLLKNVMDINHKKENSSFCELIDQVPRIKDIDIQKLDDEWRNLPWHNLPQDIIDNKYNSVEFYKRLMEIKDNEGNNLFKYFSNVSLQILALPTSNVDVERLFSKLNLIKKRKEID